MKKGRLRFEGEDWFWELLVPRRLRGSNFNREKNIMRKLLICLFSVIGLGMASLAVEAQAETFSCRRPDGAKVCTISSNQADPSVQCNQECLDCNMVCTAQRRVVTDGGQTMTAPSRTKHGRRPVSASSGTVESPRYCSQQYANCVSSCRSNPNNRGDYDREACVSSCASVRSGCGRRP